MKASLAKNRYISRALYSVKQLCEVLSSYCSRFSGIPVSFLLAPCSRHTEENNEKLQPPSGRLRPTIHSVRGRRPRARSPTPDSTHQLFECSVIVQ